MSTENRLESMLKKNGCSHFLGQGSYGSTRKICEDMYCNKCYVFKTGRKNDLENEKLLKKVRVDLNNGINKITIFDNLKTGYIKNIPKNK